MVVTLFHCLLPVTLMVCHPGGGNTMDSKPSEMKTDLLLILLFAFGCKSEDN
jgi:hypothetical protein